MIQKFFSYLLIFLGISFFIYICYNAYWYDRLQVFLSPVLIVYITSLSIFVFCFGSYEIYKIKKSKAEQLQAKASSERKKSDEENLSTLDDYLAFIASGIKEDVGKQQFIDIYNTLSEMYTIENPFMGKKALFYFEADSCFKVIHKSGTKSEISIETLKKKYSAYNKSIK